MVYMLASQLLLDLSIPVASLDMDEGGDYGAMSMALTAHTGLSFWSPLAPFT